MSNSQLTGLGEPDMFGKKSLFQPSPDAPINKLDVNSPHRLSNHISPKEYKHPSESARRIHITTDLPQEVIKIIQVIQQNHRLRSGKVLPVWKIISQAIEHYHQSLERSANKA